MGQFIKHVQLFAKALEQKKFPFEIVIVPTLPSQKELALLRAIRNQPWCSVHEFNQRGLYAAWNYGISVARGDVYGPWNADDIRFPEAVMEAQELANGGVDISYYPFYIKRYLSLGFVDIPVKTKKVEGEVLEYEKRKFEITMTAGPHFMFTKKAYEQTGPFDEQFKIAGDFDWCARAARRGLKFQAGKNYSGIFRVDGNGLSAGANKTLRAENNIVYKRQNALEKVSPGVEELEAKYRKNELLYNGVWQNLRDSS